MNIVKLREDNLDQAAELFNLYRIFYKLESDLAAARNFLKVRMIKNESQVFLCMDQNKAVGFMQLYPTYSSLSMKPQWILNDLYVVEDYRKKGVAKLMMEKADHLCKETGANGLNLMTAIDNIPAQKLYESLGWKKVEKFFSYSKKI